MAEGDASRPAAGEDGVRVVAETDLRRLLASLGAERRPGTYVFATVAGGALPSATRVLASVLEDEGPSVVLPQEDADAAGIPYDFVAAWITLRVRSDLAAIGLTAAVSSALTAEDISCNVIAGRHHDHLLVPFDRVDDALAVLRRLAKRDAPAPP